MVAGSTEDAVLDPPQDLFNLLSPWISIQQAQRCLPPESPVGSLEPTRSLLLAPEHIDRFGEDPDQPEEPVRIRRPEAPRLLALSRCWRREIQRRGDCNRIQREPRSHSLQHGEGQSFPDLLLQILGRGRFSCFKPPKNIDDNG